MSELSPLGVYQRYLGDGKLAYQYSVQAGKAVFFPRAVCPYTGVSPLEWRVASGKGTVYSTTTVHARNTEPYNVALVDCDEGFRLMTRVEGVPSNTVEIGMRVQFAGAKEADGELYPVFAPEAA